MLYLQSTEVKNANAMELESLKRQLAYLEESNVEVKKLITDRHTQVSAYMAWERPNIKHTYDVWHLAKGSCLYTYSDSYVLSQELHIGSGPRMSHFNSCCF